MTRDDSAAGRAARKEKTAALYARIPVAEAEKLDRAAFELKMHKRELISALLARYVDPSSPAALEALRGSSGQLGPGAGGRRITVEARDDAIAVGRHSFQPVEEPEVLTPAQLAALLQLDEEVVIGLARTGELPARRIGADWRFSRRAVLEWLGAGDRSAPERRSPGG
jgi:excisionase family DNA binding protein